MDNVF
jgi:GDP-D-mannose dehydratase